MQTTPNMPHVGADPQPDPQWAALRRAVRAVLDQHDRARAPFYVYVESALGARTGAESSRARAIYAADSHLGEPGDVYVAVFDPTDTAWPDPVWSQFQPAPPERVAIGAAPSPTPGPVTSPAQVDSDAGPVDPPPIVIDPQPVAPVAPVELDRATLIASADQLFWQRTGYKPNTPLNPNDPADRRMIPQWWQAYADVRAMWAASFTPPSAPPGPHVDPAILQQQIQQRQTPPISSGAPTMNSRDLWLPILQNAPLSIANTATGLVGASAAEYGLRSSARARTLVGALAPVLAPATGPITAKLSIDANQVLHGQVCVDGKCYTGVVDLSGPIAGVLAQLAAWHRAQHAADSVPPSSGPGSTGFDQPPAVVGRGGGGGVHGGGGYHAYHGGGWHGGYGGVSRRYYPPTWRRYGGGYSYYRGPYWYQPEEVVIEEYELAPDDAADQPDVNAPGPDDGSGDAQQAQDAAQADPNAPAATVQGCVKLAGELLVRDLVGKHVTVACAGWFDDFKSAVSSAASGLEHAALGTLKKLKGPIAAAASYAAASVPGIGPVIGPMASKLAGNLVDAAAGNPAAQQVVQQATQQAKSSPTLLKALHVAHQMAAKATAAYHLATTATNAAQGDPAAQAQVQQVVQQAQAGDPAAQQAAQVMNQGVQATAATATCAPPGDTSGPVDPSLIEIDPQPDATAQATPATSSGIVGVWAPGFVTIVGAAIAELRAAALQAVQQIYAQTGKRVLGYLDAGGGTTGVYTFDSSDQADDWFGRQSPDRYVYVAYFDAGDPTWPGPLNEATGNVVRGAPKGSPAQPAIPRGVATVQGWPIPLAFGAALGAGGMAAWDRRDAIRKWLTGAA